MRCDLLLSAFLGCAGAGLTLTTLNPTYKAEEIARQLENSGAKYIITIGREYVGLSLKVLMLNLLFSAGQRTVTGEIF